MSEREIEKINKIALRYIEEEYRILQDDIDYHKEKVRKKEERLLELEKTKREIKGQPEPRPPEENRPKGIIYNNGKPKESKSFRPRRRFL